MTFKNTIQASHIRSVRGKWFQKGHFLCTTFYFLKSFAYIITSSHKIHLQFLRSFNNVQIKKTMFIIVTPTQVDTGLLVWLPWVPDTCCFSSFMCKAFWWFWLLKHENMTSTTQNFKKRSKKKCCLLRVQPLNLN